MATQQEKAEFIRQATITANPEIVELKFGCGIRRFGDKGIKDVFVDLIARPQTNEVWIWRDSLGDDEPSDLFHFEADTQEIESWIIIGRPIRLADVLIATKRPLSNRTTNFHMGDETTFFLSYYDQIDKYHSAPWDLKNDSLEYQSPETISFLYQLLGGQDDTK